MARHGMRNTRELVGPLRERGITLSESQIYRLVGQNPERISFQLLAALCDVFDVEANELITFTATDARSRRKDQAIASGENVVRFADAYKPLKLTDVVDSWVFRI